MTINKEGRTELQNDKKRFTPAARESERKCLFCKKDATLKLDDGQFICENCAMVMNDLGIEQ